jgi:glycosyltransferase involved in cell wall biosynthesis
MKTLTGLVAVRNLLSLDYCFRESIASLLPVVDEMLVCDSGSDDGTTEVLHSLASFDPKIRVINYPWPNPKNNPAFWVEWLNWARQHAKGEMLIQLDADEVLCDGAYGAVREFADAGKCGMFDRLNFWQDHRHLVPHNRACGRMVARMGPSSLYLPSDEPHPAVKPNMRTHAIEDPRLRIFHYGFIRNPTAFVRKSLVVQNAFFGSCDSRITEFDGTSKDWREKDYFDGLPLIPYVGNHPIVAHQWLRDRGYAISP